MVLYYFFFLMFPLPPRYTLTATLFPFTPLCRSLGLVFVFVSHLEFQSAFACRFRQRLDAPVKQEAATVEHDPAHARRLGALRQALAHIRSSRRGCSGRAAHVLFQGRGGRQRAAGGIVDDLGIDVLARAMHRQARPRAGFRPERRAVPPPALFEQRKIGRAHTSELQSLMRNSYAAFCLKTKNNTLLLHIP